MLANHGGSPQTPLWGGLPNPPLRMRFDASPDPSPEMGWLAIAGMVVERNVTVTIRSFDLSGMIVLVFEANLLFGPF